MWGVGPNEQVPVAAGDNLVGLTTFGPWKRVNSMLQAFGIYQMTRPNPPYTPPEAVTDAGEHTTLQPIQL